MLDVRDAIAAVLDRRSIADVVAETDGLGADGTAAAG
jgi:hypothetical protein